MSRIASTLGATLIVPDFDSRVPLNRQIYSKLRDAILRGHLAPGAQIPSSRDMARELGVGRNTVLNAVEQLIAEGYLQSEHGAGTYVNRTLPEEAGRSPRIAKVVRASAKSFAPLTRHAAALRGAHGLLPPIDTVAPFLPCVPALDAFPFDVWGKLVQRVWRKRDTRLLGLGAPAGYLPLRQAIAEYLLSARAIDCAPEQVIIVSGAQQALDLVARVLIEPGDPVWLEEPGYQGTRASLMAAGAKIVPVPVDADGLNVQAGSARGSNARMICVTPSHQFPLGHAMSLARRLELLAWSKRARAWILEDDYDSEYRYTSRPIPALYGLATDEQVLYVGTLSKVLYPSLRLGYLVVPPSLVDAFATMRVIAAGPPPLVEQAVLAAFITEGHFGRHIRRMRMLYQRRRTVMIEAAKAELEGLLDIHAADAGLHAVGWLSPEVDDEEMCARAAKLGITTIALSSLYHGAAPRPGLVLGFAAFDDDTIRHSMRMLARALATAPRLRKNFWRPFPAPR